MKSEAAERFGAIVARLRRAGVQVVLAKVEGAVYGRIGESQLDETEPRRRRATSILDCALVDDGQGGGLPAAVPALSTKRLFDSLIDNVGAPQSAARVIAVGDKDSLLHDYRKRDQLRATVQVGAGNSRRSIGSSASDDGEIGALFEALAREP